MSISEESQQSSGSPIHNPKTGESELQGYERQFQRVINTLPIPIWVNDDNKRCNFFNQSWLSLTGRSLEQELGEGWVQGMHPADVQCWYEVYNFASNARQGYQTEYRLRQFDGEYRWLLETGVPYSPDDTSAGYIGFCIDITERRQAEAVLRQSEERFRQLIEHIHEVFWIRFPDDNTVFYVSPAYETIWGRTCESLYAESHSWLDAITPKYRERLMTLVELQQEY